MEIQKKHEDIIKRIQRLRLLDDDFMTKVFEDRKCAELLLQIILGRKDLKVQEAMVQHDLKNLQGRSVRLDIFAVDTKGKYYNIEVQREDQGAGVMRARYNSSLLDANTAETGTYPVRLNETYVIFITERDVLKKGLPIYHIDRTIAETGEVFGDGAHIIYVNSKIQDETSLGKLMSDFYCTKVEDMNYQVLADRVRYFKEDEEGVAVMCKELEEMCQEAREEGKSEGRIEDIIHCLTNGTEEDAKRLLKATEEELQKARALL